jgi:hypothetical protein
MTPEEQRVFQREMQVIADAVSKILNECERRPGSAFIRRRDKNWHETCR